MRSKHEPVVRDIKGAIAKKLVKAFVWIWALDIIVHIALHVGGHHG